ncbi:type IV inositol polyphosphate 5-phosphatase 9 [Rhodamnia argentea]|uniref:Type IV inositol polyphosphate 5-phosphatase 9 n=1 Tax=Rhodamnia argentea TaxID=178133 RepID=A0ABM3HL89_9MYRT|nr:type IV inositol polyphosphate 5-phosphatase 9 [Rhodamnia argentea]
MWTRLVANKILKMGLGSNNFVADYPIDVPDSLLDFPILEEPSLGGGKNILNHHKDTLKYKVFVSTWNVGGTAPEEDLVMEDFFDTSGDSYDIYVLGFQEIVPLKASNVLGSENTNICMKWNSLIRMALNGSRNCRHGSDCEKKRMHGPEFRCVISKQMVGIFISVWVRGDLRPYISHPSVSCVGCGVMGCLGNKGSVSVRFQWHETSFCFVCTHLASGGREGDEKCRTSNAAEILSRTTFPRGPLLNLPRKILDHDRVILLGDLNYRISLPEAATREPVDRKEWNTLLDKDQLMMELMNGQVLQGWHEGKIKFAPTYKYIPNSDLYYGCFQRKKGEKRRSPAWCDRIIWCGKGLKQHLYTRGESRLSDHRPVKAIFTAEVGVSQTLRGLQSLFLSKRFNQLTTRFEVSSKDDGLLCKGRSSFQI